MSTTRRAALVTFAGLGAGLGLPKIASAAPCGSDMLPALYAEKVRLLALLDDGPVTEDEADALMEQWGACEAVARSTTAKTPAGAIASLKWARDELRQFGFRRDNTDNGTRLVLAMLQNAIEVLSAIGGGA